MKEIQVWSGVSFSLLKMRSAPKSKESTEWPKKTASNNAPTKRDEKVAKRVKKKPKNQIYLIVKNAFHFF